jgi:hypothetical protein
MRFDYAVTIPPIAWFPSSKSCPILPAKWCVNGSTTDSPARDPAESPNLRVFFGRERAARANPEPPTLFPYFLAAIIVETRIRRSLRAEQHLHAVRPMRLEQMSPMESPAAANWSLRGKSCFSGREGFRGRR